MKWTKKKLLAIAPKMAKEAGIRDYDGKSEDEFVKFVSECEAKGISIEGLDGEENVRLAYKAITIKIEDATVVDDGSGDEFETAESLKVGDEEEDGEDEGESSKKSFDDKRRIKTGRAAVKQHERMNGSAASPVVAAHKRYNHMAKTGKTVFSSSEVMEATNAFIRLGLMKKHGDYAHRKADEDIVTKAGGTYDNVLGGFTVPNGVADELIELKATFGIARQLASVTNMPLPKWDVNRFGDDVVVYKTSEGSSMTQSDMTFGQITLISEEIGALSVMSNRLLRLSAVQLGETFSRSAMRGFGKFEDDSYFNGANGFEGLATKVGTNSTKDVTGLTAWSGIGLTDLLEWKSKLPAYTDQFTDDEIKITCTRPVFDQVFRQHAMAQGGSSMEDQLNAGTLRFDGNPIVLNNSTARTFANNAIAAYIGPFSHVTKFGELDGSMSFDESTDRYFDSNSTALRALEEIAINCHDVNDSVDSDGNTTSGVIALQVGT